MANLFQTSPELNPIFPDTVSIWTCPLTGLKLPKDPLKNLQWRVTMMEAAENDPGLQQDLFTACSQSILFFCNAFAFTLRLFEPGEDGSLQQADFKHLPFVTWRIQDKHILRIEDSIDNGKSLLTDKSRDMGATWDHIVTYVHRFLFRPSETHLMISRKEDAVDMLDGMPRNYPQGALADPGTLFGKIDYVLNRLPEWMLPAMSRKKMHLSNLDNGCRIDGESSNASAGSSDRRTSIYLDEMAKMDEAESIWRSTADVTACRLPCSTPNGAGTTYSKLRMSGKIPVFILPWWEHPEKGKGRNIVKDELGRFQIQSPWYVAEKDKRTPKEMAIEIDMDHVGSGELFFETTVIEKHKIDHAKDPKYSLNIHFNPKLSDKAITDAIRRRDARSVEILSRGTLKVWCNLTEGRPDQTKTYTIGCDLGKGQGASNSVAAVLCNETKEKIAEFADATLPGHEFAKMVCALCVWVGGRKRPLLIWENNGDPGFEFGYQVSQTYQYPNVYFDKTTGTVYEKRGKRWGWRSSREKKAIGLGLLRRAYSRGLYINHSERSLDEALMYVHYDNGGIGPALLQTESEQARATHGDRVIADMLCVIGRGDMPNAAKPEETTAHGTFAHRFKDWKRGKRKEKSYTRLNINEKVIYGQDGNWA